jgi:dTDP-4-amino-4,6-dideoxygalactose transaminase
MHNSATAPLMSANLIDLPPIPFNRPYLAGREFQDIADAVLVKGKISGAGAYSRMCALWLETQLQAEKALLTHSCTAALEMAALLCDIRPGDEVIMPSFTFSSTANAFALRGAVPVFVDIRQDTLNIDERLIEGAITARTKAIVPVHYAGYPCDMRSIMAIAEAHRLFVIEDAAQALLGCYGNRRLGTIGDVGCFSFHETKNIISGEGGAILVNRPEWQERAEIVWEKGTNRMQMMAGLVDKYTWLELGSSFAPSEIIAAFLHAQFERAGEIIARRRALHDRYRQGLAGLAPLVTLPCEHADGSGSAHIFHLLTRTPAERTLLLHHLAARKINAIFHYVPLHSSPAGRRYGRTVGDGLPVTDHVSATLVRLPLFYEMREDEIDRVVAAVAEFYAAECYAAECYAAGCCAEGARA